MIVKARTVSALVMVVVLYGCTTTASVKAPGPQPIRGIASWYGEEFAGRVTASGDIFDPFDLTAAHPALPFGTIANVTNISNGAVVQVRINDRGPYVGNRIVDLSYAAAQKIGLIQAGIGMVELTVLALGDGKYRLASAAKEPNPASLDEAAPAVSFPLPDQVGSANSPQVEITEDHDFEIEVIEERGGRPMRRRVSADGRDLETVPIDGGAAAPVPSPAQPVQQVTASYFLQLGAFQSRDNADTLRQKARRLVANVMIEESDGMHRVRVGPFPSRERALQVQEDLQRADLPSMLLSE